jgi:hypothetical protein
LKKQKENMKSVLTAEQLKKLQEVKKPGFRKPGGPEEKYRQRPADKETI